MVDFEHEDLEALVEDRYIPDAAPGVGLTLCEFQWFPRSEYLDGRDVIDVM